MNRDQYQNLKRLFNAALDRPEVEREAYLAEQAGADAELLKEVRELLASVSLLHGSVVSDVQPGGDSSCADADDQADATASHPLPSVEAKSILMTIAPDERPLFGVKLADLEDESPPPKLVMGPDKYNLLEELGSGGMGKVYLAYDKDTRRHFALKIITGRKTPQLIRRFLEEAQVLAQLQHPNIVPMFEVGLNERPPVLTLRYDPTRGTLDTTELREFLRHKNVTRLRDHFFLVDDIPHLALIIEHCPVHASAASTAPSKRVTSQGKHAGRTEARSRTDALRETLSECDRDLFDLTSQPDFDSYGCRVGKGTDGALRRAQHRIGRRVLIPRDGLLRLLRESHAPSPKEKR